MIRREDVYINGSGETSRDFCYVDNAIQMNLLAALASNQGAVNQVYNTAVNARTNLNELYKKLHVRLLPLYPHLENCKPVHRDFRPGDVMHSQADITKAENLLGYAPTHMLDASLDQALTWYIENLG